MLMLLESACVPFPSEVTMLFGGALTTTAFAGAGNELGFWAVVAAGTIGNLVGSWLAYWAGSAGGRPLIDRYGRYLLIHPHEIDTAHAWFDRHGEAAVFGARLLPVVRTFISLPAGIAGMRFWRFTLYTILGCLPWCLGLTWLGRELGTRWERVEELLPTRGLGDRRRDPHRADRLRPQTVGHGADRVRRPRRGPCRGGGPIRAGGLRRRAPYRFATIVQESPSSTTFSNPARWYIIRERLWTVTESESGLEPFLARLDHAGPQQRLADPLAAMQRRHRDRELRRLLVHEPVAGRLGGEPAVPRRADRLALDLGDDAAVALATPSLVVPDQDRVREDLLDRLARPIGVPPGGLVEHLLQERHVVRGRGSDVHRGSSVRSLRACARYRSAAPSR